MRSLWITFFVILGILACLPVVEAFGAGEIPSYATIKGQVFHILISKIHKSKSIAERVSAMGILRTFLSDSSRIDQVALAA